MVVNNCEIDRRRFVKSVGITSSVGLAGCIGGADSDGEYPSEPIELIVPFGEGGGTDTFARQIMPLVSEELGVDVAIKNVPGAGSLRGVGEAYNSEPDGYTMMAFNPPSTPISAMVQDASFDLTDVEPVSIYGTTQFGIWANPELEITDFADLLERYKSGELAKIGGQSKGGVQHVLASVMKNSSEYDFNWETYVGYGGSAPALRAVVQGEVPIAMGADLAGDNIQNDGNIELVAMLNSQGSGVYPDAPTVTEEGYPNIDYVSRLIRGYWLPPETPDEKRDILDNAIESAVKSDKIQSWAEESGNVVKYGPPKEAGSALEDAFKEIPERVDLESIGN